MIFLALRVNSEIFLKLKKFIRSMSRSKKRKIKKVNLKKIKLRCRKSHNFLNYSVNGVLDLGTVSSGPHNSK